MSNYTYADLFDKSTSKKEITIETEDKSVKITNSEIHFEQFELKEILCDDDYLTFGQCNASQLKFKISNVFTSMIGKQINVSAVINGHADAPFIFGKYRVVSDKPTDDKRYRNVTAYDAIYDIGESEVSSWYNGLKFPLTLKQFRDSFFSYSGVEQVATTLPNDSMEVAETIKPSELSGQTVMEAICSINGCFGHINHDGKFEYIFLKEIIPGLYPHNGLYPKKGLYPKDGNIKEKVKGGKYKTVKYEDFVCQKVTKVQIRQSENDIGAVYPDTEITDNDNSYILQDNFLVYGMTADALETVARNLYDVIKVVKYRPYNCEKIGNPCLKLGEAIKIYTKYVDIESYVLSRSYKGIQQPIDTISASGKSPKYSEQVNGINKSIIQLRGKTNELERNVEETRSEIKDVENGLDTKITQNAGKIEAEAKRATEAEENISSRISQTAEQITSEVTRAQGEESKLSSRISQTAESITAEVTRAQGVETDLAAAISVQADQITAKVSKGDVSSQLSIESGQVSISGNRFVLSATNCSISADGTIKASNVDLTGKITASSGEIGGFTIGTSSLYTRASSSLGGVGVHVGTDGISCGTSTVSSVIKSDGSAEFRTYDGIKIWSSTSNYAYVKPGGITIKNSTYTDTTYSEKSIDCYSEFKINTYGGLTIDVTSIGNRNVKILAGSLTYADFETTTSYIYGGNTGLSVGRSGSKLGFFGSTGNSKKSITSISSTSSATASSCATKINELINALKSYNLIG